MDAELKGCLNKTHAAQRLCSVGSYLVCYIVINTKVCQAASLYLSVLLDGQYCLHFIVIQLFQINVFVTEQYIFDVKMKMQSMLSGGMQCLKLTRS